MEQRLIECLRLALINNASDIHFTLAKNKMKIELRINKKIYPIKPKENDDKFFRYLMYRANIDLSNKSIPQTGNFEITFNDKVYSLRLALLNTKDLSCGVLRILNNHHLLQIKDLCDDDNIIDSFYQIANINNGLILFSGPTCSGKTTTLVKTINLLKNDLKIAVMEADIDSDKDAITVSRETGVDSIQIHTGGMCHLDADMTAQGINELSGEYDLIILENVGNLVCPAEFDTGACKSISI